MKVYNQPEWYTDLLDYINLFFTFFFVGEFMLKFGAFRFKNYFSDPWNGFDFFIVVGSLIDLGFAQLAPDSEVDQKYEKYSEAFFWKSSSLVSNKSCR